MVSVPIIPVRVFTDCHDSNAADRVCDRLASELAQLGMLAEIQVRPVEDGQVLAGDLVDCIDALARGRGEPRVVMANVAPRSGTAHNWENGSPFGWFRHGRVHVFATVDGETLSLAKKLLGPRFRVRIFDMPATLAACRVPRRYQGRIVHSQFRSYEFLPLAIRSVLANIHHPQCEYQGVPSMPWIVWKIDCFDNLKTTLLPGDVGFSPGGRVRLSIRRAVSGDEVDCDLPCYQRLRDVPDGEAALVVGSSGLHSQRLLEISVQGGSASERFDLNVGATITPPRQQSHAYPVRLRGYSG